MMPSVSLIMYHYVRNTDQTPFPKIHARACDEFDRQLDHIASHYTVISIRDYEDYLAGKEKDLPASSCILTFDDGFKEHHDFVLPRLLQRRMVGAFYPITESLADSRVAIVHKVQHLLAHLGAERFSDVLEATLFANATSARTQAAHAAPAKLPYRYDDAFTSHLKNRIAALPADVRREVIDRLFHTHISNDEAGFAQQLYMTGAELKRLQEAGMDIGGHTHTHPRLALLSKPEQEREIHHSQSVLAELLGSEPRSFAYPYGDHNTTTIEILRDRGITLALSTLVGVENEHQDRYRIRRLNTNDLPH